MSNPRRADYPNHGHCPACGHLFIGKQNHCTQCHQTFAGERAGDSHRTGPHDPPGLRRCRTPDELEAGGMWTTTNSAGTPVWHGKWSASGVPHRQSTTTPIQRTATRQSHANPVPGTTTPPTR